MNTNYSGIFNATKINTSDCGNFCHDSCPNLIDNRCNVFGGTLEEQKEFKRILSEDGKKLRWNACKIGTEMFKIL